MTEKMTVEYWKDGEEYIVPTNELWPHACCACGLVHNVKIRVIDENSVGLTFVTDEEATETLRNVLTIEYLRQEEEEEENDR